MRTLPSIRTAVLCLVAGAVLADDFPQPLPLAESWTLSGRINDDDDWTFVPGIQGFRGDGLTDAAGADPQTVLAADDPGVVDVNANLTDGGTDLGGVNELELGSNPVVALQGSETADAPYLKLYLDTTGQRGVTVRYRLRDVDPSADDAVQAVALQYRVGASGLFTNVPAAFVADATQPNAATLVTPVCAALPVAAAGAPRVELRILTANAVGDDENVGVDDILVSTQPCGPPQPVLSVTDVTRVEGNAGTTAFAFQVLLSAPAGAAGVRFDVATADGTATAADGDYVPFAAAGQTIAPGATSVAFTVLVNGDGVAEANEAFFLNVGNVTGALAFDGQGQGTIVNDDIAITSIHDVQGRGSRSPIGAFTVNVSGVVTGVRRDGFYVQQPVAEYDADPATSEGVFVSTPLAVPAAAVVGNRVRVTGVVTEFGDQDDLMAPPVTSLGSVTGVVLLSTGNPLPAPALLATAFVAPTGRVEQLERFEGMLVSVPPLTVFGPTLGAIDEANASAVTTGVFYGVVAGTPRPFREAGIRAPDAPPPATAVSIPPVPRFDGNPERIRVDSAGLVGALPIDVARGATVTGLVGPLDFASRTYTVLVNPPSVSPAPVVARGLADAIPVADPTGGEVTLASIDLQRFYDTVNDADVEEPVLTDAAFARRLRKASLVVRNFAKTPDLVAVTGVDKRTTLEALAARIGADATAASQPDPQYLALLVEGFGLGGTNAGFLVKQQPVGGVARVAVGAVAQEQADEWFFHPDGSFEPLHERPPLRLSATVHHPNGASFDLTVIATSLQSRDGIDNRFAGSQGWPTIGWRVRAKRRAQAESVARLVQSRQQADPSERIAVAGGFDAFAFNDGYVDVLGTVKGTPTPSARAVLTSEDLVDPDLVDLQPADPSERYSVSSLGDAQAVDHVLVNRALLDALAGARAEFARTGADFPETARNDRATALRVSDHDPLVVFLRVPAFSTERTRGE